MRRGDVRSRRGGRWAAGARVISNASNILTRTHVRGSLPASGSALAWYFSECGDYLCWGRGVAGSGELSGSVSGCGVCGGDCGLLVEVGRLLNGGR
jgi:hypothetical protein